MLIHHSGKDVARGARGHSSLRAAVDTEIELTRDEIGLITAEVTKQRAGPTGYKFAYSLRQIGLGRDQDGGPVTTCLVEPVNAHALDTPKVSGPALPEPQMGWVTLFGNGAMMQACLNAQLMACARRARHD